MTLSQCFPETEPSPGVSSRSPGLSAVGSQGHPSRVSQDVLLCWAVRHRSRGNRLLGKQGISEQQSKYFLKCPRAFAQTIHSAWNALLYPSTWLIPLPPSGLDSLSPFWTGLYCVSSSLLRLVPDLPALLSLHTLFLRLLSTRHYVSSAFTWLLSSQVGILLFSFPARHTALRPWSGTQKMLYKYL